MNKKVIISLILVFTYHLNLLTAQSKSSLALDSLFAITFNPGLEVLVKKLEQIEQLSIEEKDKVTQSQCLLYITTFYSSLKDPLNFEKAIYRLLEVAQDTSVVPYSDYSMALNNASQHEKSKGNYIASNDLLLNAIQFEKSTSPDSISKIIYFYHNIALNYIKLGDYINALKYSDKALEYAYKEKTNNFIIAEKHFNKGIALRKLDSLNLAQASFKKSLESLNGIIPNEDIKALKIKNYHIIAEILITKDSFNEAESNILLAENIQKTITYRRYKSTELRARINQRKENYNKALNQNLSALKKATKLYNNSKENITIPRIQRAISNNFKGLNKSKKALARLNLGLGHFNLEMDSKIDSIRNLIDLSPTALNLLIDKMKLLLSLYETEGKADYLKQASIIGIKSIEYLDKMKAAYINEGSKFFIAAKANKIYGQAVEVFEKCLYNKDYNAVEDIFMAMEKNKASVLLENLKYKYNILASALPKEVIKKNTDLKSKISFYSKLLSEVNLAKDLEKKKELEDILFHTKEEYNIFKSNLKLNYPEYESFKNDLIQTKTIKDVQLFLKKGEFLVEYLQTKTKLFRLEISPDNIAITSCNNQVVDSLIQLYSLKLRTPPLKTVNPNTLIEISKKLGSLLLPSHDKDYEKLIVIPDGTLTTIPFESLILNDNKYLIEKSLVTYSYSAEQLLSSNNDGNAPSNILCIAPEFNGQNNTTQNSINPPLNSLPYAKQEALFLENNFDATLIRSANTSPSDLLENMSDYAIIHLATHATLNISDPMLSEIHFNNGSITNYDIRDLNVQPVLVVLSACNTAQGEIQKGEGIISLSRGFFEAGVKGLQSSLWAINDQSSSEIMEGMYSHMKSGKSTMSSLRQAKLDYLKSTDKKRSHPYYWAAMIHIGDDSILFDNQTSSYSLIIFVGVSLLLLGVLALILIYFKTRSKNINI